MTQLQEQEVLKLLSQGQTSKQIEKIVFRSHRTVEGWKRKLFVKFGVRNVAGLVGKLARHGAVYLIVLFSISVKGQPWIAGGSMHYERLGNGIAPGTISFRVVLKIRTQDSALAPGFANIWLWNNDDSTLFAFANQYRDTLKLLNNIILPCEDSTIERYWIAEFRPTFELPINVKGYTAIWTSTQ